MKINKFNSLLIAFVLALATLFAVTPADVHAAPVTVQQQKKSAAKQSAQPQKRAEHIVDEVGILSASDLNRVNEALAAASERCGAAICVMVTNRGFSNDQIGAECKAFADRCAQRFGTGAVVLVNDIKARKWNISNEKTLKGSLPTKRHMEYMSRPMVKQLKANKYADAYIVFADKAAELTTYYLQNGKAMPVSDSSGKRAKETSIYDITIGKIAALLIALACAAVYAYFSDEVRTDAMSNVHVAENASAYVNRDTFQLYNSNDTYLYQTVVVTPRASASSSSDDDGGCSFSSSDDSHDSGGGSY